MFACYGFAVLTTRVLHVVPWLTLASTTRACSFDWEFTITPLANWVTENLKVFLESLREGGHFKPWGNSEKLAIMT